MENDRSMANSEAVVMRGIELILLSSIIVTTRGGLALNIVRLKGDEANGTIAGVCVIPDALVAVSELAACAKTCVTAP